MKPIKHILVAGLGAVGGAYAMKFHQRDEFRLQVLASGDRKTRYQNDGFLIKFKYTEKPMQQAVETTIGGIHQ